MPFSIHHLIRFPMRCAVPNNLELFKSVGTFYRIGLLLFLLAGCTHVVFPVTRGSHAPLEPSRPTAKRVVVWSNDTNAGNHVIALVQQIGLVVVERARLQQIFDEQKIRLTHTPDDDPYILRVGKLIGADRVILVEVTEKSTEFRRAYVGPNYGGAQSGTEYHVSAAIRGIDVETGEIRWSGTAQTAKAINNPGEATAILVELAAARALCPLESGYQWKERTSDYQEAYCMKDGKQVDLLEHKHAILPLL
jgi:hypothetical protein